MKKIHEVSLYYALVMIDYFAFMVMGFLAIRLMNTLVVMALYRYGELGQKLNELYDSNDGRLGHKLFRFVKGIIIFMIFMHHMRRANGLHIVHFIA